MTCPSCAAKDARTKQLEDQNVCEFCLEGADCCKPFDNSYGEMVLPTIPVCTTCWNKQIVDDMKKDAEIERLRVIERAARKAAEKAYVQSAKLACGHCRSGECLERIEVQPGRPNSRRPSFGGQVKITDKMRLDWLQKGARETVRTKLSSEICSITKDHHCRCDWASIREVIDFAIRAEKRGK